MARPRKGAASSAPFFDEPVIEKNELTKADNEKIIEDYIG